MRARDIDEEHRAATPLELFFDLVFVVAIAAGARELHHGLAEGHLDAVLGFTMVFLATWWAWMNFTWFASAYDCDDVVYRVLTFLIMTGSLGVAAGVHDMFVDGQSTILVGGYCLMRLAMVALWLRAAAGHPERRRTCLTYAAGITLVQAYWVARLLVSGEEAVVATFFLGMALELLVPWVAERNGRTPFHPHHIAERYGLFTIIVLGEVILSIVIALEGAFRHPTGDLVMLVLGALLVVLSMWWLYFKRDHADLFHSSRQRVIFLIGYGHLFVFASVAAAGAALAAAVDVVTHHAHASPQFAGLALGVPVAAYCVVLAGMHAADDGSALTMVPAALTGLVVLVVPLLGLSMGLTVLLVGLALAAAVVQHVLSVPGDLPDATA
ncbi:low temperature requirement protein A [Nocardioides gansuensis]|uniref:Low temperature requirement protein A n=2 Tax=Nocardioides gansuensis TaxID=2138300 RepID=A0A2T8FG55_9ACTN|nr:low temperature requirement protein A [Nocardioides gansuensis]